MPTVTILRFDRIRMRRLREAKGLTRDGLADLCPNVSAAAPGSSWSRWFAM